ncbi:MAG: hypothetical protein AB7G13_20930 [Lautropia sp.]
MYACVAVGLVLAGAVAFLGGAVRRRAKPRDGVSKWLAASGAALHVIAAWILAQQMRSATAIFFVLTVSMAACVALPYLAALTRSSRVAKVAPRHADPK